MRELDASVRSDMPVTDASPSDPATVHLQLLYANWQRSPYAVVAADALLAWLIARAGFTSWAVEWLLATTALSFGRSFYATRKAKQAADQVHPRHPLRVLTAWNVALGSARAWVIIVAFAHPAHDLHYIVTMVMMGLAAGNVATVMGSVRLYVAWGLPIAASLVHGWLSKGAVESTWIALLLVLLSCLLTLNVRGYGHALARQVELSRRLRAERDRADGERRRAEAERLRAEAAWERAEAERQRAEQAVVARTRFFSAASHDLRQPLGVLR